jgi:predicted transcriptional regulator of viral defense system
VRRQIAHGVSAFCAQHAVFHVQELDAALGIDDTARRLLRRQVLRGLAVRGVIVPLIRGTYAVAERAEYAMPNRGVRLVADRYALASRMRPDAVLAYRTALEVHGAMPARGDRVWFLTRHGDRGARRWGGTLGIAVDHQTALRRSGHWFLGVSVVRRAATSIRVTTRERTLVDVLDRPRLIGTWAEILPAVVSLVRTGHVDWSLVALYARRLSRATTAGRVGWLAEQLREEIGVPDAALATLEQLRPRGPFYWSKGAQQRGGIGGRYYQRWNVVVPLSIAAALRRASGRRDIACSRA